MTKDEYIDDAIKTLTAAMDSPNRNGKLRKWVDEFFPQGVNDDMHFMEFFDHWKARAVSKALKILKECKKYGKENQENSD